MPDINERRLNRFQAADFLCRLGYRVAHATLSKYATIGGGPEYEKFGRRPLYTEKGLLDWVRSRTITRRAAICQSERPIATPDERRRA